MADLLIQGMHLPKLGHVTTITIYHDGTVADKMGNVETVKAVELPPHGKLKDADLLQEALSIVLSLVMTPDLTDKEIALVQRTIGAVSSAINEMETVLEASE